MERLKQKRKTQRYQVTKVLSEIDAAVEREVLVEEELRISLARLNTKHGQLNETDTAIVSSLWQPFWEQFEQVVHNNRELLPTDKFNYLRAAPYEEAAAVIAGIPATASCYEEARDILKTRCGDEKRLIDMIRLLERERIQSSLDVQGLRRLHDDLHGHIRWLRSLGVSEETFSTLLHPLILRLLPEYLVLAYHRTAVGDEKHRRLSTQSAALSSNNSDQDRGQKSQLPILLRFLREEVESRERTSCTKKTDHILKYSSEEKQFTSATSKEPARSGTNIGTAAALLQRTDNQECAFCLVAKP
ncbi:hypothetical protein HPB47_005445 [Ixodes persulcatus]|uniref:Uncharacterized protein n=1 Tax=Ixodes persulcatus TaxID=34615 RepID=A0AC60PDT5_IXOPE|nr:hypothetical protein HPB47_005445 [Ixodes persulcatus]